ncbi:MAG: hypothetical protein CMB98_02125 [Flavobacteriaceae bacterium]|nr:hypothetical protein [Flavobacteriaceae bacterium]
MAVAHVTISVVIEVVVAVVLVGQQTLLLALAVAAMVVALVAHLPFLALATLEAVVVQVGTVRQDVLAVLAL